MSPVVAWACLAAFCGLAFADIRQSWPQRDKRTNQRGHFTKLDERLPVQPTDVSQRLDSFQTDLALRQTEDPAIVAGRSVGKLATGMLKVIYDDQGAAVNCVTSPLSLWILLVMLLEAAGGNTHAQLAKLLSSPENTAALKSAYRYLNKPQTEGKAGSVSRFKMMMLMRNFVVRNKNVNLSPAVAEVFRRDFQVEIFAADLEGDKERTVREVNLWAARATGERIREIITEGDLDGLKFLIGNAVFFQGLWKYPFNRSATYMDQFKNSTEDILGDIPMMSNRLVLKYAFSDKLSSQVIEIPYADDKTSMVVILPRRKLPLGDVLNRLKGLSLAEAMPENMADEEVDLYLPRFTSGVHLTLNKVLVELGAADMLNEQPANFTGFGSDGYVSRIVQKATIENHEEGTTATGLSSAHVSYKTSSVTFHANRPFIYFINDVRSRAVLFAGTLSNPNSLDASENYESFMDN